MLWSGAPIIEVEPISKHVEEDFEKKRNTLEGKTMSVARAYLGALPWSPS
jgi:hypothetical protein